MLFYWLILSGTKGIDYFLVRTYPGVSEGIAKILPKADGISGVTTFTLSLSLWTTSNLETLKFDVYYYNSISYTS